MKKWIMLFAIVLALPCLSQTASDNIFKMGMIKLSQGYALDAISFFNNAIKNNPEYAKAYIGRAKAKLALSETSEALNDINKACSLDKNNPEVYYVRSTIYNSLSEKDKALTDLDQAIRLKPDYNEALADRIIIRYSQNKDTKIADSITGEIKKKEQAYLFFARGVVMNIEEKYSKALTDFNRSLTLDSTFNTFEIYRNKSYSLLRAGKNDEALESINKAISLKPGMSVGYFMRGQVLYDAREYTKALEDFNQVLKIRSDDSFAVFNSGMCYLKLENTIKACECFHKACKAGNENACKMSVIHCSKK